MGQDKNADLDLLGIAKAQKAVLWCILAGLCCFGFPMLYFVALPFQLYFTYLLAKRLRAGLPVLWCLGMFVPVLSLALLFFLSQRAVKQLTAAGYKVGFMGADLSQFKSRAIQDLPPLD